MKKLSNKTMSEVQGGVTLAEYCRTAYEIIANNDISMETQDIVDKLCDGIPD